MISGTELPPGGVPSGGQFLGGTRCLGELDGGVRPPPASVLGLQRLVPPGLGGYGADSGVGHRDVQGHIEGLLSRGGPGEHPQRDLALH